MRAWGVRAWDFVAKRGMGEDTLQTLDNKFAGTDTS